MISRKEFDRYLDRFHARDYALVLDSYAADMTVSFGGITLKSRDEVLRFYRFFHSFVQERIDVGAFASSDDLVAIEARVLLTGIRELTPEIATREGYQGLLGPPVGRTLNAPQFIHYRMNNGKFTSATCLLMGAPTFFD